MQLPHLNKDLVNASLMRAGVDRAEANTRAPLDLRCPRLDVDTTDGCAPALDRIVERIEELHDSQVGGGV